MMAHYFWPVNGPDDSLGTGGVVTSPDPKLRGRLLIGAVAGIAGAMAMTAAMSRFHRSAPWVRSPSQAMDDGADVVGADASANAEAEVDASIGHFGYGALAGSVLAAANPPSWSDIGCDGGSCILDCQLSRLVARTRHSDGRNTGLRIRADATRFCLLHISWWGVATARAMRELLHARDTMMDFGKAVHAGSQSPQFNGAAPD